MITIIEFLFCTSINMLLFYFLFRRFHRKKLRSEREQKIKIENINQLEKLIEEKKLLLFNRKKDFLLKQELVQTEINDLYQKYLNERSELMKKKLDVQVNYDPIWEKEVALKIMNIVSEL